MAKLYIGNTAYKVMLGDNSGHIADLPTIVWNYLLKRNAKSGATINGVTFTYNSDGTVIASGTATASTYGAYPFYGVKPIIGHKYLLLGGIDSNHRVQDGNGMINDTGNGAISTTTTPLLLIIGTIIDKNATEDNLVFKPKLFDVTQMFGEGNEPTSVEQFKQWFTDNIGSLDDVYPYNPGQEIKVKYLPKYM